jgi:hypothetical protein
MVLLTIKKSMIRRKKEGRMFEDEKKFACLFSLEGFCELGVWVLEEVVLIIPS